MISACVMYCCMHFSTMALTLPISFQESETESAMHSKVFSRSRVFAAKNLVLRTKLDIYILERLLRPLIRICKCYFMWLSTRFKSRSFEIMDEAFQFNKRAFKSNKRSKASKESDSDDDSSSDNSSEDEELLNPKKFKRNSTQGSKRQASKANVEEAKTALLNSPLSSPEKVSSAASKRASKTAANSRAQRLSARSTSSASSSSSSSSSAKTAARWTMPFALCSSH